MSFFGVGLFVESWTEGVWENCQAGLDPLGTLGEYSRDELRSWTLLGDISGGIGVGVGFWVEGLVILGRGVGGWKEDSYRCLR